MRPNPQFSANLVTFNEKTLNGKLHFLCSGWYRSSKHSIYHTNKTLNKDLEELSFWLNPNKIALNLAKTGIILFKTNNKNYDADLNIKHCRKRFRVLTYVKYVSVFIN